MFFFFQDNAAANSTDNANDDSGDLWKTRMREVRVNKNYNYSTMLNISYDMAARKLVKFNSGLSQIFIKVPLSKNMKLELIKYFRAFTPRSTN